ncbi:hypothetical protein [Streptomyces sp. NPDC058701]|uniref:hypothetical protein n=1 Tax=Streptomyces sp. NPDC058701 TaxID=3346608 RepID=UPI00365F8740
MELSVMLDDAGAPRRAADGAAALEPARAEAFREAGVTPLNVMPAGPEPARLIETVRNWL